MSKKLLTALSFIICAFFALSGCSNGNSGVKLSADNSGNVSGNGGFVAETGDYVYFINGIDVSTADNVYGEVVKAALMRAKKSDLASAVKTLDSKSTVSGVSVETVVPKLLVASDYNSGIYIFGDYVYFATPNSSADKLGDIDRTKLELCRVKLDGTDYQTIATAEGNSTVYRFVEVSGTVYLYYQQSETVTSTTSSSSSTTVNKIYVYNCSDKSLVYTVSDALTYIIDNNVDGTSIYYTKEETDEATDTAESFNSVYSYVIGATEETKVFYGAGSNNNTADVSYTGKGVQGVKFTLIAAENGYMYFSVAYVDTSLGTITNYCAIKASEITSDAEANYLTKKILLNEGSSDAATIFVSSSYYIDVDCIIYLRTTSGLNSYNYNNYYGHDDPYETAYGVTNLFYDSKMISATASGISNGYFYYNDAGVYYRIKLNGKAAITDKPQQLSGLTLTTSSSWYGPEVVTVGETEYLFSVFSGDPYYEYVYVTALTDKGDEVLANNDDKLTYFEYEVAGTEETVGFNAAKRLGVMTDTDSDSFDDYMTATFSTDSTTSSDSSASGSGCGSSAAFGSLLALAFVVCGAASLKNRK